jgi:hypothetical protein
VISSIDMRTLVDVERQCKLSAASLAIVRGSAKTLTELLARSLVGRRRRFAVTPMKLLVMRLSLAKRRNLAEARCSSLVLARPKSRR